jgi:ABC-type Fe3+ transport system substrate-binding protein
MVPLPVRRFHQLPSLTLAAGLLLSACSGSSAPAASSGSTAAGSQAASAASVPYTDEIARLVAAAKSAGENQLDLAWGETTIGGGQTAQQFGQLFGRVYGLNVTVHFTPAPSMTTMAGKIAQEAAAGQKASTDVFLGSEGHFAALLLQNALESYDYTKLSPRIAKDTLVTNNIGLEISSRFPGVSYNSKLVPPDLVPHKLADLLNPKLKPLLASEVNAGSWDRVAYRPEWTPDKMKAFLTQYSNNISGLIRCEELERLTSGEFGMFALDCGDFEVKRQVAKGAPLAHVIPEDAALAVFFFAGIPKTAAHPNLAKLYINLMMSEQGQKMLYDASYSDLHTLPGSRSAEGLKALDAKGIKPLFITPRFIVDHPDDVQLRDDLQKILAKKG